MNLSPGTNTRSYRMNQLPTSTITKPQRIIPVSVYEVTEQFDYNKLPGTPRVDYSHYFTPRKCIESLVVITILTLSVVGLTHLVTNTNSPNWSPQPYYTQSK